MLAERTRGRSRRAVVGLGTALSLVGCSVLPGAEVAPPGDQPGRTAQPPSPEPAALARYYRQQPSWQACGAGFDCAEVTVPLDYAAADAVTLTLSLTRRNANEPSQRLGSLIVNPGGPGASGMRYARQVVSSLSDRVLDHFDVVGFDPRGVGASSPVDCVDDADLGRLVDSEHSPDTASEVAELDASLRAFRAGCLRRSADLLPHVGTLDVARDLDVIRAVVGDVRLSFLGKSYGTSIGTRYARLFPDRVGRLVLDGAVDPNLGEPELSLQTALAFEDALARFAQWCVAVDCGLGGSEAAVLDAVDGVLEATDEDALPVSGGRQLSGTTALYGVLLPLYLPGQSGYRSLTQAVLGARDGDGRLLLRLADVLLGREADGSFTGNLNEAIAAINCRDRGPQVQVSEAADLLPEFEARAPRFGSALAWSTASCAHWPEAADEGQAPVDSQLPPILVIGTEGDPATPYEWAEGLVDFIPSATLLTWTGSGHTAYAQGSDCVDQAVEDYLLSGRVPTEGMICD